MSRLRLPPWSRPAVGEPDTLIGAGGGWSSPRMRTAAKVASTAAMAQTSTVELNPSGTTRTYEAARYAWVLNVTRA
jgi:hypothetical protein